MPPTPQTPLEGSSHPLLPSLLFPEPWVLGRMRQTGSICWMMKGSTERSWDLAKVTQVQGWVQKLGLLNPLAFLNAQTDYLKGPQPNPADLQPT